jgi:hypothetical protein
VTQRLDSHRGAWRVRAALVPAGAAIAAVVMVGAFTGWFDRGPGSVSTPSRISIASAVNTEVELPDGTTVEGSDGLKLPDGAVVRTGPDGRASVGNVDLGPGQEATVDGNRITVSTPVVTLPTVTVPPVTLPPVPGLPQP